MGGSPLVEQVEMLQHVFGAASSGNGTPGTSRDAHEDPYLVSGEIVQRGVRAGGGIERTKAEQLFDGQVVHQAGIDGGDQFSAVREPATNQLRAGFRDQRRILGCLSASAAPLTKTRRGLPRRWLR